MKGRSCLSKGETQLHACGIVAGGALKALTVRASEVGCSRLCCCCCHPCSYGPTAHHRHMHSLLEQQKAAPTWAAAMAFSQAASSTSRSLKSSGPIWKR